MFTDQQAIGLQPTLFTEQREGLLVQPSVVGGIEIDQVISDPATILYQPKQSISIDH